MSKRETTATMRISAMLPYFGGKRNMADEIVREIGPHSCYWEPFCGSLAVLFSKDKVSSETINDLHHDVVNLAFILSSKWAPDLFERLQRTSFCEPLFRECRAKLSECRCDNDTDRAYCFFVESWMGRNGVAGTRAANTAFCVRYTSNGGDPAIRFASAVDSIPAWHDRLRRVAILERDAFELLDRIEDKAGTVIYADPPYLVKGAQYLHDFADADHQRLADLLRRFEKTRVVVSYYDHPELARLYPGWTNRRIEVTKAMVNQGMRDKAGAAKATEVLLINGESFVERQDGGLFGEPSS